MKKEKLQMKRTNLNKEEKRQFEERGPNLNEGRVEGMKLRETWV
jgi:hypothetical protein